MPIKKLTQDEYNLYTDGFRNNPYPSIDFDLKVVMDNHNRSTHFQRNISGKLPTQIMEEKGVDLHTAVLYCNYASNGANRDLLLNALRKYCSHPEILIVNYKMWSDILMWQDCWEDFDIIQDPGYEVGGEDDEFEEILNKAVSN
jgi:hypothetical protein